MIFQESKYPNGPFHCKISSNLWVGLELMSHISSINSLWHIVFHGEINFFLSNKKKAQNRFFPKASIHLFVRGEFESSNIILTNENKEEKRF